MNINSSSSSSSSNNNDNNNNNNSNNSNSNINNFINNNVFLLNFYFLTIMIKSNVFNNIFCDKGRD